MFMFKENILKKAVSLSVIEFIVISWKMFIVRACNLLTSEFIVILAIGLLCIDDCVLIESLIVKSWFAVLVDKKSLSMIIFMFKQIREQKLKEISN